MATKESSISKMRWMIFLLGLVKIPLIGYLKPKLISLDDQNIEVKIRLRRRSKNHLNSMYFGALAVGADVSAGVHAFYYAEKMGKKVSFAFKSMQVDFLKRAESDVIFRCEDGLIVRQAIEDSISQGVRINQQIKVNALNSEQEVVAAFVMEISVRCS